VTAVGEILAAEIRRAGPISFHRFMEAALYHPEHGYYRRARDPFGKEGDFFTAEQIQPVFGILMAARIRQLYCAMGKPADFTVVEFGAGRGEMSPAFAEWRYIPVEIGMPLPRPVRGVVFSNEFFDALPVEVITFQAGAFRQQLVGLDGDRFMWQTGGNATADSEQYLRRFFPSPVEGGWYEVGRSALNWMAQIAETLTEGYVLTVDYGYTRPESIRFPAGTLMGYHRHTARENVLDDPGERDITSHVNFTAVEEAGVELGLKKISFETLARTILDVGEPDGFATALAGEDELRRRMQLKTLLFGMGETFRVLLQEKEETGGKRLKQ
jgi:SAM-dependent MidA family methyltransferase